MAARLEKRLFRLSMLYEALLLSGGEAEPRCGGWVLPNTPSRCLEEKPSQMAGGLAGPSGFNCAIRNSSTPAASTGPKQAGIGHGVKAGTP